MLRAGALLGSDSRPSLRRAWAHHTRNVLGARKWRPLADAELVRCREARPNAFSVPQVDMWLASISRTNLRYAYDVHGMLVQANAFANLLSAADAAPPHSSGSCGFQMVPRWPVGVQFTGGLAHQSDGLRLLSCSNLGAMMQSPPLMMGRTWQLAVWSSPTMCMFLLRRRRKFTLRLKRGPSNGA